MKISLGKNTELEPSKWYEFTLQMDQKLVSIMLKKEDSGYLAYENLCPHQGRRLDYIQGEFLLDDDAQIICPAHGAVFAPQSGECMSGPCKGQSLKPVELQIENDEVFAIFQE